MENNLDVIAIGVGQPYPVALPFPEYTEGCILEIEGNGGLHLFMLYPDLTEKEYGFLEAGFSHYAVGEFTAPGCTLAYLVFKFPAPGGYVDCVLHAGLYPDDRGQKLVDGGGNALHLLVLDRRIVRLIRMSGIDHRAMDVLRGTVRKQLAEKTSRVNYDASVRLLQQVPSKELYRRGKVFRHRSN